MNTARFSIILSFALSSGLAIASPGGSNGPFQPGACPKILLGNPVAQSLVEDLNVTTLIKNLAVRSVKVELDPSAVPTSREYENNVAMLNPADRSLSRLKFVIENPRSEVAQKFRTKGNLEVHAAQRKISTDDVIRKVNSRFERSLNLGLRFAFGNARVPYEAEARLYGAILDDTSAFLALHGVSYTITSRAPNAKVPRIDDFFFNLYNSRGQFVGRYDPIETLKNIQFARQTLGEPEVVAEIEITPPKVEARIKRINELLEASRQRVMKQLDEKIANEGLPARDFNLAIDNAMKLHRAENLRVTVERLPEKSAYQFNGITVQPGHYVLRFHNAADGKTEFRVFSAEQLK